MITIVIGCHIPFSNPGLAGWVVYDPRGPITVLAKDSHAAGSVGTAELNFRRC